MRRRGWFAIIAFLAGTILLAPRLAHAADSSAVEAAEATSLVGVWTASSFSVTQDNGHREVIVTSESPCNVTITDKRLTIRRGAEVCVELDYTLDRRQEPWALNLSCDAGRLLGICARQGERLQISLNEASQGRPRDFSFESNGMVLNLTPHPCKSLFLVQADGSGLQRVVTRADFTKLGSPDWSHDGHRLALDGWRTLYGETTLDSQILVMRTDGSELTPLGLGAMPSWSLDDTELTYSTRGQNVGVWIMKADGSQRRCIAPDGFGSQWSPRRNEIALGTTSGRGKLFLFDVETRKMLALLERSYQEMQPGMAWSPDGEWICFKALRPDGQYEIAAVRRTGERQGFKILVPHTAPEVESANATLAWGGTGDQILIFLQKRADRAKRLYLLNFNSDAAPSPFPGLPEDLNNLDAAWSLDGRRIAFTAFSAFQPGESN